MRGTRCTALLVAALLIAACGRKTQTIPTPGGPVTVTEQGGSMTMETPEGTVKVTGDQQSGTTTVESEQGKVTATQDGDNVKVTTSGEQGETSFETGANVSITADELGLKFYPGATVKTGARTEAQGTKTLMVQLTCAATPKEVYEFYKKELGGAKSQSQLMESDQGDVFFINQEGDVRWAIAGGTEDGATIVTISRIEEAKGGS